VSITDPDTDEHVYPYPWRLMAVVALIVIAATVLAGIVLARNSVGNEPVPGSTSTAEPTTPPEPVENHRQITILLQVRDQDREAISNVLFGIGGKTGFVAELLLPRNLLLPTVPPSQLKNVDGPTGPVNAQGPVETLLGVQVDAAVEMDRLAWAGLLDSIGQVPGISHADQPSAFPLVLDHVLSRLPGDERAVGQLLTSLGSMARTTVTNEDASHILALLGESLRTQDTKREVLPVISLRAGAEQVDIPQNPEAEATLQRLFPLAQLQPGHSGQTRVVLVRSGAGIGHAASARIALADAGFGVINRFGGGQAQSQTSIFVPVDSDEARAHGAEVAAILGLPPSSVRIDPSPGGTVDVRVMLGSDFRPV
jgi:hypothetical protein